MRLGVLYSGGKDSNLALYYAKKHHEVVVLLNIEPSSDDSELFHYINNHIVKLQSKALDIPLLRKRSSDTERDQLLVLRDLLKEAKVKYNIRGIVTGAVRSTYQSSRFQKICRDLDLWCFNPLWLTPEEEILDTIIKNKFVAIITRLAYENPDVTILGKPIDKYTIDYLKQANVNLVGEGGEYETIVLDSPIFKKKIVVDSYIIEKNQHEANFIITSAHLKEK